MKIGIMSMQRIINYGSFLQAYSLQKMLKEFADEVEFVDYHIEPSINKSVPFYKRNFIYLNAKLVWRKMFPKKVDGELYRKHGEYLKILGISDKKKYRSEVDVLVIGSDEVFNCLQENPDVGFSKELFGVHNRGKKLVSYAASFGTTTLEGLREYGKAEDVKRWLEKFDFLSVRDENSSCLVQQLCGKAPQVHVDPVILLDMDECVVEKKDIHDYILIYAYRNRIKDPKEIKAIQDFAKAKGKKIVSVGVHQDWTDIKIEANPFEMLGYIKNADYVVTDTFHGTVFSIKLNKKFVTLIRESNRQKLVSLLRTFHLESRSLAHPERLDEVMEQEIPYEEVNKKIGDETERTRQYFQKILKNQSV